MDAQWSDDFHRALHTLLTELSTGLQGTGQEMGKLVDQGSRLLERLT